MTATAIIEPVVLQLECVVTQIQRKLSTYIYCTLVLRDGGPCFVYLPLRVPVWVCVWVGVFVCTVRCRVCMWSE